MPNHGDPNDTGVTLRTLLGEREDVYAAMDMFVYYQEGEQGRRVAPDLMDPAKVTRAAIENASSVAAMVLTTESLITDVPEPAAAGAPAMPPMDY